MKPHRTYSIRMGVLFVLYTAAVVGINLAPAETMPAWSRIAISLIPVIPAVLMIFAILAFVRSMDEVQQRVITESCLVSLVLVGLASFSWGFIEGAIEVPPVSLIWVFPALIGTAGIAQVFVRRRYM